MLILFRERPEIRDDLGELGAVYPPFPPALFGFGEAFIHGALDRLRQGLTGPLGELANFGLGGRIFDDHPHSRLRIYYHSNKYILASCILDKPQADRLNRMISPFPPPETRCRGGRSLLATQSCRPPCRRAPAPVLPSCRAHRC